MRATVDPHTWIEAEGPAWVVYVVPRDGERWVIAGTCVACGACEVGHRDPSLIWTGLPIGWPAACLDPRFGVRLDMPVRPELPAHLPSCSLRGWYL